MNFLRDKGNRDYILGILLLCTFLLVLGGFFCLVQTHAARELMLKQNEAAAGVLLEHHVPLDVIASALTSESESTEGRELLARIGLTENTPVRFVPLLSGYQSIMAYRVLITAAIWIMGLILLTVNFLNKREHHYLDAIKVIRRFADGCFDIHLPRCGEGELNQLFTSVDGLASALQAKMETERQTKEFLKHTIADISHQLKTPLAALEIYQGIISEEPDNPDAVAMFSQKTEAALDRMNGLIQALLKITRLDAGSIFFEPETVKIADLASLATRELTDRAEAENKKLKLYGDGSGVLQCDLTWTAEAIGNLVKNALDHTRAQDEITVTWEQSPAVTRIHVEDNGSGIAPEDLHHIFKRFYRSQQPSDQPGIGLGLPLAKAIITGQGGILTVQSVLGQGSIFTVTFLTGL